MNGLVLQLALLQLGLPLALLVLNACLPSGSRLALAARSTAIALVLLYAALAGVWLFPPWWTPGLLLILHLGGSTLAWQGLQRKCPGLRGGFVQVEYSVTAFALAGIGLAFVPVLQGRSLPAPAIDLALPLGPGSYLVVNGGSSLALNAHLATLDRDTARAFRGQSRAVDIIGIDSLGLQARGLAPRDPARYRIFGTAVRAPCAGEVAYMHDGRPDMPVPDTDRGQPEGNAVLLACAGYAVLLAHLTPGSVAVALGERVETGQLLGRVGNSGNSNAPHLHLHVQRGIPDAMPLGGEPLWFTIEGRFLVRNTRFTVHE